jgi:hypothetical protein
MVRRGTQGDCGTQEPCIIYSQESSMAHHAAHGLHKRDRDASLGFQLGEAYGDIDRSDVKKATQMDAHLG